MSFEETTTFIKNFESTGLIKNNDETIETKKININCCSRDFISLIKFIVDNYSSTFYKITNFDSDKLVLNIRKTQQLPNLLVCSNIMFKKIYDKELLNVICSVNHIPNVYFARIFVDCDVDDCINKNLKYSSRFIYYRNSKCSAYTLKILPLKINVKKLTVYIHSEFIDEYCCVCYDKINLITLSCKHITCLTCRKSLRKQNCPMCRTPIYAYSIINSNFLTKVNEIIKKYENLTIVSMYNVRLSCTKNHNNCDCKTNIINSFVEKRDGIFKEVNHIIKDGNNNLFNFTDVFIYTNSLFNVEAIVSTIDAFNNGNTSFILLIPDKNYLKHLPYEIDKTILLLE